MTGENIRMEFDVIDLHLRLLTPIWEKSSLVAVKITTHGKRQAWCEPDATGIKLLRLRAKSEKIRHSKGNTNTLFQATRQITVPNTNYSLKLFALLLAFFNLKGRASHFYGLNSFIYCVNLLCLWCFTISA